MKFKMPRNSVFAVLLRSPWWISALIALLMVAGARATLRNEFFAVVAFAAIPFAVIAVIAFVRQWRAPSAARVQQTVEAVRTMPWPAFAEHLQEALRRDGCEVTRLTNDKVDFTLRRKGRLAVMSARRWKASRVGVEALRDLADARRAHGAQEGIYVTVGDVSEQARTFAQANQIQFLASEELARLLPKADKR